MKEEIKGLIAKLNNGEAPKGYKKTDIGIFPKDWVTDKTFGDLFDFYGGLGKSRDELGDKGCAYLHYGDLHKESFNKVSYEQYLQLPKCDVSLKVAEKYQMEDGDVAFLDASEDLEGTSRSVLIDNPDNKPFIAGLHIIYGKSKDDSLEKWYKQYITSSASVKKQFQRLAAGFKVYGVNRNTLPKVCIAYPKSKEEQSKIAEILMKWDKAIELYQEQIEALEKLKKAYLSVMFPKKGETTPKYRFKGFTDPWEQRKLGEISESFEYGLNAAATEYDGKHKYIRITDIDDSTHLFIQDNLTSPDIDFSTADDYLLQAGDVLFARTGASVGKTYIYRSSDGDLYFAGFLIRAKIKRDYDADFVFQNTLTDNYDSYIRITSQRSGQPGVNAQEYANFALSVPCLAEQKKIGAYFTNLDNLITLHQRKKETIIKQRKVLQQYLLNGIVRV